MNDATVRGKMRLLDLVPEAQEKLSSGGISESAARSLLSMQAIASKEEVVKTVKRIEKNAESGTSDKTIDDAIRNMRHEVVDMWDQRRQAAQLA